MCPFIALGSLLLGHVGHTAALALSGWSEPEHSVNATAGPANKRFVSAYVAVDELATIYSTGDVTKRKTAGFGFNFQVDWHYTLWGFCPVTMAAMEDCLVGSCYDKFSCSTGCGFTTESLLNTISCTATNSEWCLTAILTPQSGSAHVTMLSCGDGDAIETYMGFTIDLLREAVTTSTETSTSSATSPSQTASSSQQTPGPDPSITPGPQVTDIPNTTSSLGGSQSGTQSGNSGGSGDSGSSNNNIGAIVGGSIGGLAVLCAFGLAIIWILRRNKNANDKSSSAHSSTLHDGDGSTVLYEKPELAGYARERVELFGQPRSEMSSQTPSAYDTSSYRPNYPPMTPVELPVGPHWK